MVSEVLRHTTNLHYKCYSGVLILPFIILSQPLADCPINHCVTLQRLLTDFPNSPCGISTFCKEGAALGVCWGIYSPAIPGWSSPLFAPGCKT